MEFKKIITWLMALTVTGCGGFTQIGDTTAHSEVCRDYNESHETIVDVTNVEFTDTTTGEPLVDGNFLIFHRSVSLESELTDTWEIFVSLSDTDLFAFKTSLNVAELTSETSFNGFSHGLYSIDESFSFDDLLECMEATAGSFYTGCSDFFPTEYRGYGLSPRTITPTGDDIFKFEGSYGYYQGDESNIFCFSDCSEYEDEATFIGFDITFDLTTDEVDLEIDYPALTRTCHILTYEYDCSIHSYTEYSCPEGYERDLARAGGGEDECVGDAAVSCTKCAVVDENGQVILDGTAALEIEDEMRDSLCQGTKNENWDTIIDLSE